MIGSLRGTVLERSGEGEVLLEVAGVGYRITVTPRTFAELEPGANAFVHVHHHIREDAQTLYGFLGRDERTCFEALLGAHGVGPSLALAILSVHSPIGLREVVASADLRSLCLVPGVGKKTAERLLVELKGRLDVPELDLVAAIHGSGARSAGGGGPSVLSDVREALYGLGYGPEEVREALRDLSGDDRDASSLLRDALKVLGARRA
jgi:Holliday junction DNA helicase RuvA